jgi:EmrB/QacA subfamily drug resistance transporter
LSAANRRSNDGRRDQSLSVRRWLPLIVLAAAQFVMVLDSSVMNVSISQIVADLDTTVTGVQLAITAYTLVMAAFMLVGAKLGDIWGRDRAFGVGLAVYGIGSLTTALSPNLYVLLFGWSLVEGLGAVLVIPAIASLTAANYEGKTRALAYGVIGGVAGAAIAVGPVIGGWVTTEFSWRLVFVGEVVIVVVVLFARKRMQSAPRPEHPPKLDVVGAVLSAGGLGLIVFGILRSSSWGWLQPLDAPTIGGREITPLGFSLVPFLIVGGVLLLWFFGFWEERRERLGQDALLERALLRIQTLRAGLATLMSQQLVLMGTFFVLPVYLQVVLGLDAFETGKRLLPMSITMLIAALAGAKLAPRLAPRLVVQIGLAAMVVAALVLVGTIDVKLNETSFKLSLAFFGVGAGLLMSQLGNVIMSSAPPEKTNEAGGLQGTAQNLGASLGTALIGSVLLAGLLTGFTSRLADNPSVSEPVRTRIEAATEQGIDIVTTEQAHAVLVSGGLKPAEAETVTADYADAQLDGLKRAMLAVALLALLSLVFTRRLPGRPPKAEAGAGGATDRDGRLRSQPKLVGRRE